MDRLATDGHRGYHDKSTARMTASHMVNGKQHLPVAGTPGKHDPAIDTPTTPRSRLLGGSHVIYHACKVHVLVRHVALLPVLTYK